MLVAANTGNVLWRTDLGLRFGSAPIAYRIDGREYIAVVAGYVMSNEFHAADIESAAKATSDPVWRMVAMGGPVDNPVERVG